MVVNQKSKSANIGDQLKHCPFPFIFDEIKDWGNLTYSETHAGQGVYKSSEQVEPHIKNHYLAFNQANGTNPYYLAQKSFFKKYPVINDEILYCGSSLLAKLCNPSMEIRLCEWEETNCKHLLESLKNPNFIRNASFHQNIDWLTENDNTVLLLDPFTVVEEGNDTMDGRLPWYYYKLILEKLSSKNALVMLWFWSETPKSWMDLVELNVQDYVRFQANNYNFLVTGFGKGKPLLAKLEQFVYPQWLCQNFQRSSRL